MPTEQSAGALEEGTPDERAGRTGGDGRLRRSRGKVGFVRRGALCWWAAMGRGLGSGGRRHRIEAAHGRRQWRVVEGGEGGGRHGKGSATNSCGLDSRRKEARSAAGQEDAGAATLGGGGGSSLGGVGARTRQEKARWGGGAPGGGGQRRQEMARVAARLKEIGRASCRERVYLFV